jgi:membrane-bound lytic murein transglycosylase A
MRAPPPAPAYAPPPPAPVETPSSYAAPPPADLPGDLASLEGWAQEDHVAAFRAVRAACAVRSAPGGLCRQAAALSPVDEDSARAFLESNLRAVPVAEAGRLTAYFMPVYEASRTHDGEFTAPVRPPPADLPPRDVSATAHAPYADRAAIDARPATDAVAWMRPEDLFFMQIQGSGVLDLPDGSHQKAVFAGDNGAPFLGIATPMRAQGLLTDQDSSGEAIHAWLAAHRGSEADAIMRLNPRYIFFRLTADDGADPYGAAGQRLVAGRSVAVDPAYHSMGELLWLDASAPALAGAFPDYRRMVVALDTGGAIKGAVRADLYLGRGEAAGREAGRVRHALTLYSLVPRE